MNILIVKLSAIGDVVHTLPSLASLRKLYPQAHITWVVEEAAADILAGNPDLDRVIVSKRKQWIACLRRGEKIGKTFREINSFLSGLRSRRYDLVIDFHGLMKSAAIVLLSGGGRRLGYDSMQEMTGLFYTEKIPEDMNKHAVDRYLDFVRHLGGASEEPRFIIAVEEENRKKIDSLLAEGNISAERGFVAVNPVAFWKTKLWDESRFALLCDRIARELGFAVVFTGGEKEGAIESIRAQMREPSLNLGGRTTLRDLACLYGRAALVVTTDSGPMHIAAAAGTPVVALFGPTSPVRTGPYGRGHEVIRADLTCSPCFRKECGTKKCMDGISVDRVFEAVRKMLDSVSSTE